MADTPVGQKPASPSPTPQNTIDDLVKELSRPAPSSPTTPSPAPAPLSRPPATPSSNPPPRPAAPPSQVAPKPSTFPQPSPSAPASSAPAPAPVAPIPVAKTPPPQPKEYESVIRTMSDDVNKIKSGQASQSVSIPRTYTEQPRQQLTDKPAVVPNTPAKPTGPQFEAIIPAPTQRGGQSFSIPTPLRATPAPVPTPAKPAPQTKVVMPGAAPGLPISGGTSSGTFKPAAPSPSPAPAPITPAKPGQYSVPSVQNKPPRSGGQPIGLILAIIGGIVVIVVGYWYFFIHRPTSSPVATVTPTVTSTPIVSTTPVPTLQSVFSQAAGTIVLQSATSSVSAFLSQIAKATVTPGTFGTISVTDTSGATILPFGIFDHLAVSYPAAVKSLLGSDGMLLAYGQREALTSGNTNPLRLVVIAEMTGQASSTVSSWETTMSQDIGSFFGVTATKNTGPFLDNNYRGIPIRYKNFTLADESIDYAFVPFNNNVYLVITGSRESMYAAIDALSGFSLSLQ